MSQQMTAPLASPPATPTGWQFFNLDNRYIAPIFITCILLVGHLSFGILESSQHHDRTDAGANLFSQMGASGKRVH